MKKYAINLFFVLVFFNISAFSADFPIPFYFEKIGDKLKIPGHIITAMLEDSNGFLWMGTQEGLIRYDGYSYKLYQSTKDENSLSGDYIRSLWEGADGKLWIGTMANGVSILNKKTEAFEYISTSSNKDLKILDDRVEAIVGNNKEVWIGTNKGLNKFDFASNTISAVFKETSDETSLSSIQIRSLLLDNNQTLWVGSKAGLSRKLVKETHFESVLSPKDFPSQEQDTVYRLFQSEENSLWIGTVQNGLAKLTSITHDTLHSKWVSETQSSWVLSLVKGQNSEVWAGTASKGIARIDHNTADFLGWLKHEASIPFSISMNTVNTLLTDRSGNTWVGTWGAGLNRTNANNNAFSILRSSIEFPLLKMNDVRSMIQLKNGDIWLGTHGNGISILTELFEESPLSTKLPSLLGGPFSQGNIMALKEAENGDVWIGTRDNGLYVYSSKSKTLQQYDVNTGLSNNSVRVIFQDHQQNFFIGTDSGLDRWNPTLHSFESINTHSGNSFDGAIESIVQTNKGDIWVGANNGLYRVDQTSGLLQKVNQLINRKTGLVIGNISVIDLLIDRKEDIWISTVDGLWKVETEQNNTVYLQPIEFSHYGNKKLTFENLEEDFQGNLWSGQYFLDTSRMKVHQLSVANGVDVGAFWVRSSLELNSGKLLFGGTNGVLVITPKQYQKWTYSPPVRTTSINVDDKPYFSENDLVIMEAEAQSITVRFSALDYSRPNANKYKYKLKGYDKNWHFADANNRKATYTNLDPGNYELVIYGSNRIGKWTKTPLNIKIIKVAKWYQTIAFKALCTLVIIYILNQIYRLRTAMLRKAKLSLELEVKAKTADINLMSEIGKELTSSLLIEDISQTLYYRLSEFMPVDAFLLGVVEENCINVPAVMEKGEQLPAFKISLSEQSRLAVWTVINNQECIVLSSEDLHKYKEPLKTSPKIGREMSSIVYQPLTVNKQVIGVLSVQSLKEYAYTKQQIAMIRTLSSYCTIALENSISLQQISKQNIQLNEALKKLETLSLTDQLTGTYNRRFLQSHMPLEIKQLTRQLHENPNEKIGMIMIDADHFKQVNDTYGHDAGDTVLIQICECLNKVARDSDKLIRLGGEEFLIVCHLKNSDDLQIFCEKIRESIEQHTFDISDSVKLKKTCSIGAAYYPFYQCEPELISWEEIVNLTDMALYSAKKTSRNAWVTIEENRTKDTRPTYEEIHVKLPLILEEKMLITQSSIKTELSF